MEQSFLDIRQNKNSFMEIDSIESICLYGSKKSIENPFLTICIPTFRRPLLLKEAIESALHQKTEHAYLIYIVDNEDDFSETETYKVVTSFSDKRIVYFKNAKNIGMGGNWNRCGQLVDTEYFSLLHDDDLLKDCFVEQMYKLTHKYNVDCIANKYSEIGEAYPFERIQLTKKHRLGFIRKIIKGPYIRLSGYVAPLLYGNIYGAPSCGVTFRKDSFIKSGGFNQTLYPSLDWFFFVYFSNNFKMIKTRDSLAYYRWIDNASLRPEIQKMFQEKRKQLIESVEHVNFLMKFFVLFFYNDFEKQKNTSVFDKINYSTKFKLFSKYKSIRLF